MLFLLVFMEETVALCLFQTYTAWKYSTIIKALLAIISPTIHLEDISRSHGGGEKHLSVQSVAVTFMQERCLL